MALKGDRYEAITSIEFFMDQVAERGGVVCQTTGCGSGAALDQFASQVEYAANPSGRYAVGLLLNDVVNLDLTKQHMNWYQNQMQKGGKATLLRDGWVVTNMLHTNVSIGAGSGAYLTVSGLLTTNTSSGNLKVGRFEQTVDADGYCKVYIKLPQ